MDYLYKITIGIDDDKVLSMRQHDLNAVYKTVRNTFARCNFKEQESENGNLVFTIGKGKDSFSEVGIATGVLRSTSIKWNGTMQVMTVQKIFSRKLKISRTNMVTNHG